MTGAIALSLLLAAQNIDPATGTNTSPLADRVLLTLSADRLEYYLGERARLRLEVSNGGDQTVAGHFELQPHLGRARVLFRRNGEPFEELQCFVPPSGMFALRRRTLAAGASHAASFDVSVRTLEPQTLLFDQIGRYEFQVEFEDIPEDPNSRLVSNVISVDVVAAPADERAAQEAYTPSLAYLAQIRSGAAAFVPPERLSAAMSFLERFPGSRYSGPVRERLLVYLDYRVRSRRGTEDERVAYEKLTRNADTTAPQLHVQAAPSRLWPPNHKLVPVTVALSVQDDEDSNPIVELESITCDDGCDVSQDVVGAVYGTDDREFELRAERSGKGSGRTYSITYSAKDAAGNTTRRAATVVVPHDQGKGK